MKALERVGDNLIAKWRPDGATEAETQDMNKLALSILACGYLCRVYTDRPPARVHAALELRVQPGRARSRLRVLDHRDRPERRVPDLRLPRHHALRRDHAAELRHDEPGGHGRGQPLRDHPRSRRPPARRGRLLQRGAQRGTACGPRRRLVGVGLESPPAADAEVLVRLERRDRRGSRSSASTTAVPT